METLSDQEIQERLESIPEWHREGDRIVRDYSLEDFVEAVEFTNALVEPAEDEFHHPDLEVSWGAVTVNLTTHDAGGLTQNDFDLAERFDAIYEEEFQ
ncbi:MAG: 4a-hydroxytetrahydrobiopterin dehydratase [bacterium]